MQSLAMLSWLLATFHHVTNAIQMVVHALHYLRLSTACFLLGFVTHSPIHIPLSTMIRRTRKPTSPPSMYTHIRNESLLGFSLTG